MAMRALYRSQSSSNKKAKASHGDSQMSQPLSIPSESGSCRNGDGNGGAIGNHDIDDGDGNSELEVDLDLFGDDDLDSGNNNAGDEPQQDQDSEPDSEEDQDARQDKNWSRGKRHGDLVRLGKVKAAAKRASDVLDFQKSCEQDIARVVFSHYGRGCNTASTRHVFQSRIVEIAFCYCLICSLLFVLLCFINQQNKGLLCRNHSCAGEAKLLSVLGWGRNSGLPAGDQGGFSAWEIQKGCHCVPRRSAEASLAKIAIGERCSPHHCDPHVR